MDQVISEFKLNEREKIVLKANCKLSELHFCDDIQVAFKLDKELVLDEDCFQYILRCIAGDLQNALENKSSLHESIKADLGFLWNEELTGEPSVDLYIEEIEGTKSWVGSRYILFETVGSAAEKLTTWLYNDVNGEIILEVTPSYKWHFRDPEAGEDYISYAEFIKDYQPVLLRIIPKAVAQAWIVQAQELLQKVEAKGC